MSMHSLDYRPADDSNGKTMPIQFRDFGAAVEGLSVTGAAAAEGVAQDRLERDQLARDVAAIERAAAALRRGEPELESCNGDPSPAAMRKPRPVWLVIGLLWLSSALAAAGAAVAVVKLLGWSGFLSG